MDYEKDEMDEQIQIEMDALSDVDSEKQAYIEKIQGFEQVDRVSYDGSSLVVHYQKGKNNLLEFIEYLKTKEIRYSKIYSERPTLNDVFLDLTGKELRD